MQGIRLREPGIGLMLPYLGTLHTTHASAPGWFIDVRRCPHAVFSATLDKNVLHCLGCFFTTRL